MRVAIISDIHANLVALEAVLDAIDLLQPDDIWCLGDTVGYGPEPQACVERVCARASVCLVGNHDLAVVGKLDLQDFNDVAQYAARWQRTQLTASAMAWLESLPNRLEHQGVTLAHGSPRDPIWEYITSDRKACANADHFQTHLCLVGHSHLAVGWRLRKGAWLGRCKTVHYPPGESFVLDAETRWILNPGSVGQPRDGDPRASFALLDLDSLTWTWQRVAYDIEAVEKAISAARLPEILGRRLQIGW